MLIGNAFSVVHPNDIRCADRDGRDEQRRGSFEQLCAAGTLVDNMSSRENGLQRERGHKTTGAETSFAGKDLARQLQFI
jgi:hypothetical protein